MEFTEPFQSRLDPTNYRVPNTAVTVGLTGQPPFGPSIPTDQLILSLSYAAIDASQEVDWFGDHPIPGWWRPDLGEIELTVVTARGAECKFSVVKTGLQGLIDIMSAPGGVGAVAASFSFKVDGKGEVATGRIVRAAASGSVTTS